MTNQKQIERLRQLSKQEIIHRCTTGSTSEFRLSLKKLSCDPGDGRQGPRVARRRCHALDFVQPVLENSESRMGAR